MRISRRTLTLTLVLGVVYALWTMVRPGGFEVAVLRSFESGRDGFTSLWVIDDDANDMLWIRAHRPDREWLVRIENNNQVELRRDGVTRLYRAQIFDDDTSRTYVAGAFRKKYGVSDFARELYDGSDTVPVRLRPRSR